MRGIIPFKIPLHFSFLFLILGMALGLSWFLPEISSAAVQPGLNNSCIDCHQSLSDKRLSQPIQLWSESVHAEVGNTCEGCHGGDAKETSKKAMSKNNHFYAAPKEGEVASFCGKCHQEIAKNYMGSPHGLYDGPTCKDCHGSHTIQRISADIINPEKCSGCHDYESPEKLKITLQSLHNQFHEAENKVRTINGFPTDPLKKDLKEIWKNLRQVRMVSHTFDIPLIQAKAEEVKAEMTQAILKIDRLNELTRNRKQWGFLIILVFIGLTVLTYFYNKQNQNID